MKVLIHITLTICFPLLMVGQNTLPIPPKPEKTTHFTFKQFIRQPELPEFITQGLTNIQQKNVRDWSKSDSLFYAYELALLNKFKHALSYFNKLDIDTLRNRTSLDLYQLTLRKTNRFQTLLKSLKREKEHDLLKADRNALNYRIRLAEVRLYNRDRDWNLDKNHVFPRLLDSTQYENDYNNINHKAVYTSEEVDQALRHQLLYTEGTDKILSKAYEEFGDFLKKNMYLSNAYIAYSISKHFNRRKNSISKKLKQVKRELDDQKLLFPSFSSLFPKIIESKYKYNEIDKIDSLNVLISDGQYLDLDDLLDYENAKKDHLPWLDYELGVLLILFTLLVFVVLFLRTKKKRN